MLLKLVALRVYIRSSIPIKLCFVVKTLEPLWLWGTRQLPSLPILKAGPEYFAIYCRLENFQCLKFFETFFATKLKHKNLCNMKLFLYTRTLNIIMHFVAIVIQNFID